MKKYFHKYATTFEFYQAPNFFPADFAVNEENIFFLFNQ